MVLTTISLVFAILMAAQAAPAPLDHFGDLVGWGAGFASVMVVGFAKKWTDKADYKVRRIIKPAQPVLAGVLSLALPLLASKLGLGYVPDAETFTSAPAASLVGIAAVEALKRLRR